MTTARRVVTPRANGGWTQDWVAPDDREPCEPCGGTGAYREEWNSSWTVLDCGACHGTGYWRAMNK